MMSYIKNFMDTGNPNQGSLTKWEPWQKGDHDKVMILDADVNQAITRMSKEYFDKAEIVAEMKKNLPPDELNFLVDKLLQGCFFWEY
jgi:para-nitrobenzyl esterase